VDKNVGKKRGRDIERAIAESWEERGGNGDVTAVATELMEMVGVVDVEAGDIGRWSRMVRGHCGGKRMGSSVGDNSHI